MLAQAMLERLPEVSRNPSQPTEARAAALVKAMTLKEKVSQMLHNAPAIEHLGVPAYNWWNECSHGVARAGLSTVFAHAIALAATWNTDLLTVVGEVIGDEARAKHHQSIREGRVEIYAGLTFWTPNINIVRDPRWGRAQETFGEDPFLTGRMAVAFIKALQGDDPRFLKLAACAKHYAAHSGPEALRHTFNAEVSDYDLWDTYLPAFEASVREAGVEAVMGAYTRTNGEACCASPTLLENILRQQWGFGGHVVSDCGAIEDIHERHQLVATPAEAAALAVRAGCDICCGGVYRSLLEAEEKGFIAEAEIDRAVQRLMATRIRLGMFDPPETVPYTAIPASVVGRPEHRALARRATCESIVLLKNDGLLPLSKSTPRIAVIGPNADDLLAQLGNYHGTPITPMTVLEGIRQTAQGSVIAARGCGVASADEAAAAEAVQLAQTADVVVFVGGLSQVLEGEELQDEGVPPGTTSQGDRRYIELPPPQEDLLRRLHATGKPVVLVTLGGSALALPWAAENLPALLHAWYPGEAGEAVADVLFGDYNPGGRLPMTFYRSTADLPPFEDYDMRERTYRYFEGEPLYPFGWGLSYTRFDYSGLTLSAATFRDGEVLRVNAVVTNSGDRAGDDVAQLYLRPLSGQRAPRQALRGFRRLHLEVGQSQEVVFELTADDLALVNEQGERVLQPGRVEICVGGRPPLGGPLNGIAAPLRTEVTIA